MAGLPGITNYEVRIPGSSVTAYLGHYYDTNRWVYSLWDDDNHVIAVNTVGFEGLDDVTPEQVGRIAFLLEVEYKS